MRGWLHGHGELVHAQTQRGEVFYETDKSWKTFPHTEHDGSTSNTWYSDHWHEVHPKGIFSRLDVQLFSEQCATGQCMNKSFWQRNPEVSRLRAKTSEPPYWSTQRYHSKNSQKHNHFTLADIISISPNMSIAILVQGELFFGNLAAMQLSKYLILKIRTSMYI